MKLYKVISFISFLLSLAAIVIIVVSNRSYPFHSGDFLVTMLSALTTLLVAWQIYNTITFEKRIERIKQECQSFTEAFVKNKVDELSSAIGVEFNLLLSTLYIREKGDPIPVCFAALEWANKGEKDDDQIGLILQYIDEYLSASTLTREQKLQFLNILSQTSTSNKELLSSLIERISQLPVTD